MIPLKWLGAVNRELHFAACICRWDCARLTSTSKELPNTQFVPCSKSPEYTSAQVHAALRQRNKNKTRTRATPDATPQPREKEFERVCCKQ